MRSAIRGRRSGGGFVRHVEPLESRAFFAAPAVVDSFVNHVPFADAGGGPLGYSVGATDTVLRLDATGSSDLDGEPLTFGWDLNGDNDFTDAAGVAPEVPWARLQLLRAALHPASEVLVRVRVTDARGASADSAPAKVWLSRPINALLAVKGASVPQAPLLALPDADRTGFGFAMRYAGFAALDEGSLRDGDVRVGSLDGTLDVAATVVSVEPVATPAGQGEAVVTYFFPAPGGAADAADVGRYRVTIPAGSALDAAGNTLLATVFDLPAKLELNPPTAVVTRAPPPEPDAVYEVTVTYSDDTAIDPATLGDSRLELRAIDTRFVPETYERINASVLMVERVQQPDGSWAVTYQIVMAGNAGSLLFYTGTFGLWSKSFGAENVMDVSGNELPVTELARFDVVVPRTAPDAVLSDLKVALPKGDNQGKRGRATFTLWGFTRDQHMEPLPGVTVPPVDVTLYLTRHHRPRPGDPMLATLSGVVPGSPNRPAPLRAKFRMPTGLAPGSYSVMAVADSGRVLAEPNEENNYEEAFALGVKERYTFLAATPGRLDDSVKRVRRGGVLSLVLEILNFGTVAARGSGTLTAVLTARAPAGAPASGVESVRVEATVRVKAPAALNELDGGKGRVRIRLRVPRDWPEGMADALVTLALDSGLAALDRAGEKVWRAEVQVV